jgi:hypothetical protein
MKKGLGAERARLVDIRDGRHVRPVRPRWDKSRQDLFAFAENGHVRAKLVSVIRVRHRIPRPQSRIVSVSVPVCVSVSATVDDPWDART